MAKNTFAARSFRAKSFAARSLAGIEEIVLIAPIARLRVSEKLAYVVSINERLAYVIANNEKRVANVGITLEPDN
jgi:hypothetical protein